MGPGTIPEWIELSSLGHLGLLNLLKEDFFFSPSGSLREEPAEASAWVCNRSVGVCVCLTALGGGVKA